GAGGYAPAALTDLDADMPSEPAPEAVQMDLPDWLWTVWQADLGEAAIQSAIALKSRGPISLRVNLRRGTPDAAIAALAQDGVIATRTANSETAIQVTENERRIATSAAYLNGIVELQDLASQQAIAAMDTSAAYKILDYCAGGGGKALALVDISDAQVYAHDIAPERMVDLGPRADRAGVTVKTIGTQEISQHGPFDIVFCDAPCSGSGTWRRTPEAKWVMTEEKLREFNGLQGEVIQNGAHHVGPSGTLVYATCSVLKAENHDVVERFLSNASDWTCVVQNQRLPDALGDGFYFAILQRGENNR
ncbi:MAG: RsmB/NOP family class I SAM-dependent RNA methyltransferase, partial [Yoonia sp.]